MFLKWPITLYTITNWLNVASVWRYYIRFGTLKLVSSLIHFQSVEERWRTLLLPTNGPYTGGSFITQLELPAAAY